MRGEIEGKGVPYEGIVVCNLHYPTPVALHRVVLFRLDWQLPANVLRGKYWLEVHPEPITHTHAFKFVQRLRMLADYEDCVLLHVDPEFNDLLSELERRRPVIDGLLEGSLERAKADLLRVDQMVVQQQLHLVRDLHYVCTC